MSQSSESAILNEVRITIPGYTLREEIGRGGMGVVHRAHDLGLDRDVAIKFLGENVAADSFAARRFRNEARITGKLQHPGIPAVHELGELADGAPFLAMKLVKGATLQAMLSERSGVAVDCGRFLAIFQQICNAVGYAHAHGVIHRDLKPSNVMVGKFGEVQIMDWGLAKVLGENATEDETKLEGRSTVTLFTSAMETPKGDDGATRTGSVLGTLSYMSPEQAGGEVRRIDSRSDVFGLGAILCEILIGNPPYTGENTNDVRVKAVRGDLNEVFARLDECNVEPDYIALTKKCLSFRQVDRLNDGQAIAEEIARIRTESDKRARMAELERSAALVREAEERKRQRQLFYAAAITIAALAAGVAGATYGLIKHRDAAIQERKRADAERGKKDDALKAAASERTAKNDALRLVEKARASESKALQIASVEKKTKDDALKAVEESRAAELKALQTASTERKAKEEALASANTARMAENETRLVAQKEIEAAGERVRQFAEAENKTKREAMLLQAEMSARLATAIEDVGQLKFRIGDSTSAFRAYNEALAIREWLVQANPSAIPLQIDLAKSHNWLGHFLGAASKNADALEQYVAAKSILQKLVQKAPDDREVLNQLAWAHNGLGHLYFLSKEENEAILECEQAKEILTRLARENPTVMDFQSKLAWSHDALGRAYKAIGKNDLAMAEEGKARKIFEALNRDKLPPQIVLSLPHFESAMTLGASGGYIPSLPRVPDSARGFLESIERSVDAVPHREETPTQKAKKLVAEAKTAYALNRFGLSAGFYTDAIRLDASLATDRNNPYFYNAACSAALAAAGLDVDIVSDNITREKFRSESLKLLQSELDKWQMILRDDKTPETQAVVVAMLKRWQSDADLASVRESSQLAVLPESQRKEWESLWAKVQDLVEKAK